MKDVTALLIELTKKHDHVSLPTLGSFIKKNNILIFDDQETWNDEKLENHYAKVYNVPLPNAQEDIMIQVEQISKELQQSQRYLFANFGFLYLNSEGKLAFSNQLSTSNPNNSYHTISTMNYQHNQGIKPKNKLKLWVSVIVVLAAGCITVMTLLFYPVIRKYFIATPTKTDTTIANVGATEIETPSIDTVTLLLNSITTEVEPITDKQRYHVVVASESTKEKAIEKLKEFGALGYQPDIVEYQGKYRVFIGRYSDLKTAEKERKNILDKIPDAWLFKQ